MLVKPHLTAMLGFRPHGDLGGLTSYTSRRGATVWFPKSPPLTAPSYHQRIMRNRFRSYAILWRAIGRSKQNSWKRATEKASLRLGPYALFVWWQAHQDVGPIRTIERLTGETLL